MMKKYALFQQLKNAFPNEQCVIARVGEINAKSAEQAIQSAKLILPFITASGLARHPIVKELE